MARLVRFVFRSHPSFETRLPPWADYLEVAAAARAGLGADFKIARLTHVVNPQHRELDDVIPFGTHWTLRKALPRSTLGPNEPTIIAVDEYRRRTPHELAVWVVAQPGVGTGLVELNAVGQTRVATDLFGAVGDSFLVDWESADNVEHEAILAEIGAQIGMVPPDHLRFVPPEIMISARRYDTLVAASGLSTGAAIGAILHEQTLGSFPADFRAIAYGTRSMDAMATPQGRQLLHTYAHVPLPAVPLNPNALPTGAQY
jgi:hypothetical protein